MASRKSLVRARRREQGICTECGCPDRPLVTKNLCDICKPKKEAYIKAVKDRRTAAGNCRLCGNPSPGMQHCSICLTKKAEIRRVGENKVRHQTFEAYGGAKCACCGEDILEFLELDHINGGGNKDRLEHGMIGTRFYRRLRRQGYPSGFQVLCSNCNKGKSLCGVCPHQKIKNVR